MMLLITYAAVKFGEELGIIDKTRAHKIFEISFDMLQLHLKIYFFLTCKKKCSKQLICCLEIPVQL